MFEAFSVSLDRIVTVDECHNLNEIFKCPNPTCHAEMMLKSVDGKRSTHFSRFPGARDHIVGCIYGNKNRYYHETDTIIKSDLEDILDCTANRHSETSVSHQQESHSQQKVKYIHTPKQLLRYCIDSALAAPYKDDLIVDDIILDSRNLQKNARFKGVTGIRFLVGTANWFDLNENVLAITVCTRTSRGKKLDLHAFAHTTPNIVKKVKKDILATHEHFSGVPIAILGNWETEKQYKVYCSIQNPLCIVYNSQYL